MIVAAAVSPVVPQARSRQQPVDPDARRVSGDRRSVSVEWN